MLRHRVININKMIRSKRPDQSTPRVPAPRRIHFSDTKGVPEPGPFFKTGRSPVCSVIKTPIRIAISSRSRYSNLRMRRRFVSVNSGKRQLRVFAAPEAQFEQALFHSIPDQARRHGCCPLKAAVRIPNINRRFPSRTY